MRRAYLATASAKIRSEDAGSLPPEHSLPYTRNLAPGIAATCQRGTVGEFPSPAAWS